MRVAMTPEQRRYLATETLIAIAFATVLSGVFGWLLFGGRARIPLLGLDGALLDFVPQTFMIALMSVLVPTLLTRRRLSAGKVAALPTPPIRLPAAPIARALLIAALATLVLGGTAAAVLIVLAGEAIAFAPFLILKCAYGALVALATAQIGVTAALADQPRVDR